MPRKLLEKLTSHPTAGLDKKIEALIQLGLKIAPEPDEWRQLPHSDIVIIVCFAFALGLADSALYRELVFQTHGKYGANTPFMEWLLAGGKLSETDKPAAGDIVMYFDGNRPMHAGLLTENPNIVLSKWGDIDLFEHNIWQVPLSYGSMLHYYNPLSTLQSEKYFTQYLVELRAIEA